MIKNTVQNKAHTIRFLFLSLAIVVCCPLPAASLLQAGMQVGVSALSAVQTASTLGRFMAGSSAVDGSGDVDPHRGASERSFFDGARRRWDERNPEVYWAKLGVCDLRLSRSGNTMKYSREFDGFLKRMKETYMCGNGMDTNHAVDGDQCTKYKKKVMGIFYCEQDIKNAFASFSNAPGKSTAREAALFLRASHLLTKSTADIMSPMTRHALTAGRKKIRDTLRSFLIKSGADELAELGGLGYGHSFLCDSDDEGDQTEYTETLQNLLSRDSKRAQAVPDALSMRQSSKVSATPHKKSGKKSRNSSQASETEDGEMRRERGSFDRGSNLRQVSQASEDDRNCGDDKKEDAEFEVTSFLVNKAGSELNSGDSYFSGIGGGAQEEVEREEENQSYNNSNGDGSEDEVSVVQAED